MTKKGKRIDLGKAVRGWGSGFLSSRASGGSRERVSDLVDYAGKVHIAGAQFIEERLGERRFRIRPETFFQPNPRGAEVLYGRIAAEVRTLGARKVLGLYCAYQEDRPSFELGRELAVNVEVEGVRWVAVRVAASGAEQPQPGVDGPVSVVLRFDNRPRRGVDLVVALLLEDEAGDRLQRLSCPEVHLGGGKAREFRHRFTVPGDALLAARRLYLFLQVQ